MAWQRPAIRSMTAESTRSRGATNLVQRKCGCGTHSAGGECTECAKKRELVQRKGGHGTAGHEAPPIVGEAIQSSGQPLAPTTRSFMESRFGQDFSQVRVHTDSTAERSAHAIDAQAYTVGQDVVFGRGRYAPESGSGRRLLAHELAHVVQQKSLSTGLQRLTIGQPDSPLERAADVAADAALSGHAMPAASGSGGAASVQRVGMGDVHEAEGRQLELDARADAAAKKTVGPMDGKLLTPEEHSAIDAMLTKDKLPAVTPLAHAQGAHFLLHDTSSPVGAASIAKEKAEGRGPLGKGVSAYAPRDDAPTVARPDFFEAKRPSTTEREKSLDVFAVPADAKLKPEKRLEEWAKRRDALFRQAWGAAKPKAQQAAMDDALAGKSLTPAEITAEEQGTMKGKGKKAKHVPGAAEQLDSASTDKIMTTGGWSVGELCKKNDSAGSKSVAQAGSEKAMQGACDGLRSYFGQREVRTAYTASVEIVQVGVKSAKGNQNTCDPKNPNLTPLPNPPYSDNQYASVTGLYLRAAHIAGRFPDVTTHFVEDAFIQGHCDPRCFDLGRLYREIAARIGHPAGCTYGPIPSYGRTWGTNNIWWDDGVCHGKSP
jgi:hypothetical protein